MVKRKKEKTSGSGIVIHYSAGGVVFKKTQYLWLVTKSNPSKLFPKAVWRLPKGWLDDENKGKYPGPLASGKTKATESEIQEAALREVEEEAGVKANIIQKIGTERYFLISEGTRVLKFVTFYLMVFEENSVSSYGSETSEIKWLPHNEARKILSYGAEKKILDKAKLLQEAGIQESLV